ncbi:citrate synthase [Microbacterium sp.]|uniref:citrate synthase n=1 Tax=Microbacterium sp. TaxID=51671 RepID=UPI0039E4B56B
MNDTGTPPLATVTVGDRTAQLPVLVGTEGTPTVDISSFTRQTGHTTLDYGFVNTSSAKSAITYIDGDRGILRYRGYPIEQLAKHSTYLEVAWLLLYGELPSADELAAFDERIRRHTLLHEDLKRFFSALPHTAHPMSVLSAATAALSTYYEHQSDPHNPEHIELNTIRMLAKLPVIAAYAHKKSVGQAMLYPDNSLSFVDNFLKLNFGVLSELYEVNPVMSRALERLLILHEDHEQNASTSTVRLVGSTGANQFSSISAGINALYGPLHGGANEAVLEMLGRIRDSGETVERFVERVKNKEDGVKLMGFGHRVYKNYDPRAKLVKESADEVLAALGVNDPLLDLAKQLEEIALADDYFIERRLYPNVDFYTGVIYKAMGFPPRMFTVLFAIGRLPGWLAHWREMQADPQTKIGRPQQLYVGSPRRDYPGGS